MDAERKYDILLFLCFPSSAEPERPFHGCDALMLTCLSIGSMLRLVIIGAIDDALRCRIFGVILVR